MLPTTLTSLLVSLLNFVSSDKPVEAPAKPSSYSPLHFELRHQHAVSPSAHVVFSDYSLPSRTQFSLKNEYRDEYSAEKYTNTSFMVSSRKISTFKPPDFESFSQARIRSMKFGQSISLPWEEDEIAAPDIESRDTLLTLAKMANNAYVEPGDPAWYELESNWTAGYPFGWEPDADGFRGHVFATPDNSTVVLSIKGTSAGVFGGGGPTVKKDKLNDNLLFSCCCARVDWTWSTVCGCYRGGWKCDQECVEEALMDESLFYPIGTNLYNNISYMYPESNIWVIGHSLGGALAALVGVTFGTPVVTFEAPGERMAARRLHLPSPPSDDHIVHVYHTADPIAMGTCTGVLSSCALGGYAMESRCHQGKSIIYDTVSNYSWAVDIRTHGIVAIVEKLLSDDWPPSVEVGREVPEPVREDDCVECYSWEYGDFPA